MTLTVNCGVQYWFILIQKLFIVSKNPNIKMEKKFKEKFFCQRSFSFVFKKVKIKTLKQNNYAANVCGKTAFNLYSILINQYHYLFIKKILRILGFKKVTLIRKFLCKIFGTSIFNVIRKRILLQWSENFFPTKNLNLKFISLTEQHFKNYILKFVKIYLVTYFIWSLISRKNGILKRKHEKFYLEEISKLLFLINKGYLISDTKKQMKTFFLFLRKLIIGIKSILQKNTTIVMIRFLVYIGIKLMINCPNKDKGYFDFHNFFFRNTIFILNCVFFEKKKKKISLFPSFFVVKSPIKIGLDSEVYYLENLITAIVENYRKDFFFRFIFFSTVKDSDFEDSMKKKYGEFKIKGVFKKKINLFYWKIFTFLRFFKCLKYKENTLFLSLLSNNGQKNNDEKLLKIRITRYLFFNHNSLLFQNGFNLLPLNIVYQSGFFTFFKLIRDLKFKEDIYRIFSVTIALVLISVNFHLKSKFLEEKFFFLNKIFFTNPRLTGFEEKIKDCITVCKNICAFCQDIKKNLVFNEGKSSLLKIFKQTQKNLKDYLKIKIYDLRLIHGSLIKTRFLVKKTLEFLRDLHSYHFISAKIKLGSFKLFGKPTEEILFFPMKIFRSLRLISRTYFTENMREKQLIWNFESIRVLIEGSALYCSKNILYFFQVRFEEMVLFISLNRCNFIFETELGFFSKNLNIREEKFYSKAEKKLFLGFFKKNKVHKSILYHLNPFFFLNHHLFKTSGLLKNEESHRNNTSVSELANDHIYVTEAFIMKILKKKGKIKPKDFFFTIRNKLSFIFKVDPRGILIQAKNLNQREYVNFFSKKNIYAYL